MICYMTTWWMKPVDLFGCGLRSSTIWNDVKWKHVFYLFLVKFLIWKTSSVIKIDYNSDCMCLIPAVCSSRHPHPRTKTILWARATNLQTPDYANTRNHLLSSSFFRRLCQLVEEWSRFLAVYGFVCGSSGHSSALSQRQFVSAICTKAGTLLHLHLVQGPLRTSSTNNTRWWFDSLTTERANTPPRYLIKGINWHLRVERPRQMFSMEWTHILSASVEEWLLFTGSKHL